MSIVKNHASGSSARRVPLALLALLAALAITTMASIAASTPATARADQATPRGTLIAATSVAGMDTAEVAEYLEQAELDASRVRFGVDAYQIVYDTIDPEGRPTTASGLVALPRNSERDLRTVTWLHGTTVERGEVASMNEESPDRLIAFAFASAGYAVTAPDYLGLGLGPGFHPFRDPDSEVTAAIDALRATRTLAERDGRRLDERVLVSGFSQGGPATMALGRALQEEADPSLRLGALAPIGGPFDMSGTFAIALDGEIEFASQYLAYLIVAWNRLHGLYEAPSDAFRAPYDGIVEGLFDGDHTPEQVFAGIPVERPGELFTPQFMERLRLPTGVLERALRAADSTCDWQPQVPVTIYAASGDRDVPIANSEYCLRALEVRGAEVRLVDVGDVDHTTSVILSLPQVLARFDALGSEG